MNILNAVYWDSNYNEIMVINLLVIIAIFASIRFFSGIVSHINADNELFKKDNPAFAISMAGVIVAITIVLMGAIYGDPVHNLYDSIISVGVYGVLGILLMGLTRIIFDRICLPDLSIRDQILKGNIAVSIIDAGNVIATAIIIYAVMVWVPVNNIEGIFSVIIGYLISQLLLTFMTYARLKIFSAKNPMIEMERAFEKGNVALAVKFFGRRIGTAFAIKAASSIMVYAESSDVMKMLFVWAIISLFMIFILKILSFLADKIILFGVDINKEIVKQKNVALGVVQSFIYISLGLLLSELLI